MFVEPAFAESHAYATFWRDLAAGHPQEDVFKRIRKDGREIWIQAVYGPVRDASGKVVTADLRALLAKTSADARAVILAALPASRPVVALGHGERVEPQDETTRIVEALRLARTNGKTVAEAVQGVAK